MANIYIPFDILPESKEWKIGKVYRIPASSISFVFTGLDYDLYKAEKEDLKKLSSIQEEIEKVRAQL